MQTKTEKLYELSYLLSPDLKEEDLIKISDEAKSMIESAGGLIVEEKRAAMQKIAYIIRDKSEAYFGAIKFLGKPENLEKIKKEVLRLKGLLRIFFAKSSREELPKGFGFGKRKMAAPKPKEEQLKEIDKKLEEILGEAV